MSFEVSRKKYKKKIAKIKRIFLPATNCLNKILILLSKLGTLNKI